MKFIENKKLHPWTAERGGKANDLFPLEKVSERAAADIANITGIDVTGFRTAIERRQIWHILKRHGENGRANQSMSDANDIARIQYILNNYDTVAPGGKSSSYTTMKENGRSAQAQVVLFSKKIDGTYYVAEAVPNTKRKTLFVTSAFIDQNGQKETGTSQLVNAQKSPVETPEASSVSVPDSGSSAQLLNMDDSMSSPQFTSRTPTGVETSATGSIARLDENYNTDGGNIDESTEIFDDGGQRNAGMGAGGQAGAVAEGTGRSVSRSQARAEAAVLSHIKGNAQAQSPREIGVEDGSTEQSLYVLSDEDIAQSERWKRIKVDAEADGARAVLFAGDLKVYNRATKGYSKVEGIHQTDGEGNTVYYIKADKLSRNAEQIYIHEKFHDIVSRNPGLLPALMEELEERYGQQEIAALVNSYVEAYDGIYGRLDESMTADEQQELVYRYMEEVFADVYAGIKRGARSTASAKKVMESQTDEIQRAAQNKKATAHKTAPPEQKFSTSGYAKRKKYGTINISKQEYAQIQAARMSKYTTFHERMKDVDGIYAHDMFYVVRNYALDAFDTLRKFDPEKNPELIKLITEELKNGDLSNASDNRRFNEVLRGFTRKGKRNRNYDIRRGDSGIADGLVSGTGTDADGGRDLSSSDRGGAGDVKQNFSFDDDVKELDGEYLSAIERGDMETAQRLVDEAAKKAGYTIHAYHGSPKSFNEFSLKYLGTNGTAEGYGLYFTSDRNIAERYTGREGETGRVYDSYLSIKKPLSGEKLTVTKAQLRKFLLKLNSSIGESGEPVDVLSNYGDIVYEGINAVVNEAVSSEYDYNDNDVDLIHSVMNTSGDKLTCMRVLRETLGYDGIVVDNASWGDGQTIYLAFHPDQIKLADPVTYDDNGNVIPLSERFNEKETDIRYSFADDVEELDAEYARKMAEDDYAAMEQDEDTGLAEYFQENERRAREKIHEMAKKSSKGNFG